MSILAAIPVIGEILEKVLGIIDKFVPDKDLREKLKAELQMSVLTMDHTETMELLKARSEIIQAEANSEGWLTRSWRPMIMLGFFGLLMSYWLGWSPPGLSQDTLNSLFDLLKIGIGGYVVGRSAEKVAPQVLEILKKR